jgi:predicted alpha/beta superfamily hydrolase
MTEGHTLTGNIQRHEAFRSRVLGNEREILVYLPPGYQHATSTRYPVLYLLDGQNVFDAATAFGGVEWRVDETARELIKRRLIEPVIIVAIANIGADRIHEYTPTTGCIEPDGNSRARSRGLLRKYGRFLLEELKPFVDRTYRTRPESTGIGGSSLGGLASLLLGFWFPEIFTRIAALSPSIWWDDCVIYRMVEEMKYSPRASRIWLDTGTSEEGWERAGHLRDLLVDGGWRLHGDLHYAEFPGGEHNEAAWAQRFEAVLRYLYPPVPPGLKKARLPMIAVRHFDSPEPLLRLSVPADANRIDESGQPADSGELLAATY